MKKRLNFVLSFLLILAMALGIFAIPAASFENDVETSSVAMLLLNLDTNTPCHALRPNGKWYAGCLSEAVTFLVAVQHTSDLKETKARVTEEFIKTLPVSDGSLKNYIGYSLTMEDLLAIMMLSSGSDAAYLIAETVSPGNLDGFVALMNSKVSELGCSSTHFVSPGYSNSKQHITTCNDLAKIYKALGIIELYNKIMESPTYTPEHLDEEKFSLTTQNSIMNPDSPYYFRYVTGGKYSYSKLTGANLMVTTVYRGRTFLFVALRGMRSSEQNVFFDAKRMTTWAYLNLSDRKVIDIDKEISTYRALASWGDYEVALYAGSSAYKTLPNSFDEEKFSYKISVPEYVSLPIFEGQSVGTAKIYYDGQKIDDISLVSSDSEGVSLLCDLADMARYAMDGITPIEPLTEEEGLNEAPDEPSESPDELLNEASSEAAKTEG